MEVISDKPTREIYQQLPGGHQHQQYQQAREKGPGDWRSGGGQILNTDQCRLSCSPDQTLEIIK